MAERGEQVTGTRDENYDVISVLYHALKGASETGQYIRDAEEAGDQELVEFLRDYQEVQADLAERAKNLLGARLARRGTSADEPVKKHGDKLTRTPRGNNRGRSAGAQTNAGVKSGGRDTDDIVDEQSKESFPASDSPSQY